MTRRKGDTEVSENPLFGYDSHDLLEAVDRLDDVRPVISDEGYNPPEIRTQLLKLHTRAMELKDRSTLDLEGKKDFARLMALAGDLDMEISGCIENLEKISETLDGLLSRGRDEDWEDLDEDDESLEE